MTSLSRDWPSEVAKAGAAAKCLGSERRATYRETLQDSVRKATMLQRQFDTSNNV